MLDTACHLALLLGFGAHAVVPWRLARGPARGQEAWRRGATPLLLAAVLATVAQVAAHPDRAVAVGLLALPWGNYPAQVLSVVTVALLATDLLLAAAGPRLEAAGWRLAAALGAAAALAASWLAELLRIGAGPAGPTSLVAAATACHLLMALGCGELLAPGQPRWAPAAGVAAAAYPFCLHPALRLRLWQGGDVLTLAAAALLLGACRWLPRRLVRPALGAGAVLAALALARAADLSEALSALLL